MLTIMKTFIYILIIADCLLICNGSFSLPVFTTRHFNMLLYPKFEFCFFETLKLGDDMKILVQPTTWPDKFNFKIVDTDHNILLSDSWVKKIDVDDIAQYMQASGDYGFCIYNPQTQNLKYTVWLMIMDVELFRTDILQNDTSALMKQSADRLAINIGGIGHKLVHETTDFEYHNYLVQSINSSIQNWSIGFTTTLIASACIQVFFVRKMFENSSKITP